MKLPTICYTVCSVLFLTTFVVGCASSTLPAALSRADANRWADAHIDATVGVEVYHWHAYSDALQTALQGTHLFASVKPLDQCATPPTHIARVEEPYNGGVATLPIWTFLTLGIIPTVVNESAGYDFSLQLSTNPNKQTHVRYTCPTTTTLGWIALPELFFPDMTWGNCEWSDRFRGHLALAVLDEFETAPRK
jgi:hypothetical protein